MSQTNLGLTEIEIKEDTIEKDNLERYMTPRKSTFIIKILNNM